jgi:hypothetical protein
MCYRQRVIANRYRRKKQGGTCSQRVPSRTLSLGTLSMYDGNATTTAKTNFFK